MRRGLKKWVKWFKWFKWLGLGLVVGVLALGLSVKTYIASLNRQEVMIATINNPYFSSDYSTVGKDNEWILKNFQPKLVSFASGNDSNYLIVEYTDTGNRKKLVKIFVSGQTPSGNLVDKIFLHEGEEKGVWLEFEELKNKLSKGKQVRIEYLTFKGPAYDRTSCHKYLNFCALASILENQKLGSKLEERLANGETDGLIVPANVISQQLYEN